VTIRTASCRCGQLKAKTSGEPARISVCHCLACQKRSGSAFAAQARFKRDQVTISGISETWVRTADSGHTVTYSFCPQCGSTLHYTGGNFPQFIAIPLGAFDDPYFAPPEFSVWEKRKHDWIELVGEFGHAFD
jgi:hypothetical protein